ncbi:IS1096 element passenger TnpR family protein [Streptosporangium soli]
MKVEKGDQGTAKTVHPLCGAGGRACPPEDCGGPEGYIEHLRALRYRKAERRPGSCPRPPLRTSIRGTPAANAVRDPGCRPRSWSCSPSAHPRSAT